MQYNDLIQDLLKFLKKSPTPFHAVGNMVNLLETAGFTRLQEQDAWNISEQTLSDGCFITRNDSSIIAFRGRESLLEHGIQMMGAHTDSPCLKVKPNPEMAQDYLQLGVEVYGGALLHPWFDRDLSLAGRVHFLDTHGALQSCLVDFEKAVAVIPSLAIHLDREANEKHTVNKQKHLPPVLMTRLGHQNVCWDDVLLQRIDHDAAKILSYELSLYDVQAPALVGLQDEFIASARLDNLLSCYVGLRALLDGKGGRNALLVCNDHEEVGSMSAAGAQGNFLTTVLSRLAGDTEGLARMMASSMMLSADNAHALHPNFSDKHEPNHTPIINAGPVIKVNANQRYASNSETCALFQQMCNHAEVPTQSFVVRSDMGCGSTIGPIAASALGVATVDVGVPTFAMHSIRELAGVKDVSYLYRAMLHYMA